MLLDVILSHLVVSSLMRGGGGAWVGLEPPLTHKSLSGKKRVGGGTHKHANKLATVASHWTPTEGPHRATDREAH